MKAVITSFVLVLATGSPVFAQTQVQPPPARAIAASPVDASVIEAVHRQENQMEARNKLEQARAAETRKD